jgi:hypothetical protein
MYKFYLKSKLRIIPIIKQNTKIDEKLIHLEFVIK